MKYVDSKSVVTSEICSSRLILPSKRLRSSFRSRSYVRPTRSLLYPFVSSLGAVRMSTCQHSFSFARSLKSTPSAIRHRSNEYGFPSSRQPGQMESAIGGDTHLSLILAHPASMHTFCHINTLPNARSSNNWQFNLVLHSYCTSSQVANSSSTAASRHVPPVAQLALQHLNTA
jgi:hypothetical protein